MNVRKMGSVLLLVVGSILSSCASTFSEPSEAEPTIAANSEAEPTIAANSEANTTVAPETAPAASTAAEYRLGEGDQIAIQVFDEPDLTLEATVSSRGGINYSYLGDVRVAGKTPGELESYITGLLRDGYLINPSVNVSIVQFRPFFIGGEVRRPGSYPYQPGLTLDKAIALAGGLTDRASTRQMFLVKAGQRSDGARKVSLNSVVEPGDTVTIKEGFF